MSTMRCTVPQEPLNSWIFPSAPTGTMTVFGMFCPAWKFRFEFGVRSIPEGHTVRYPAFCGDTTVTFNTAAATSLAGTPPCPVTCTVTVSNAGTAPGICWFTRESAIRAGVTDTTAPATDGVTGASPNEPSARAVSRGAGAVPATAEGTTKTVTPPLATTTVATTASTQISQHDANRRLLIEDPRVTATAENHPSHVSTSPTPSAHPWHPAATWPR